MHRPNETPWCGISLEPHISNSRCCPEVAWPGPCSIQGSIHLSSLEKLYLNATLRNSGIGLKQRFLVKSTTVKYSQMDQWGKNK